jgi:hypothetical protein
MLHKTSELDRFFGMTKAMKNIRMDLKEIGWQGVDWIHLAQDSDQWCTLVNLVMNLWVP